MKKFFMTLVSIACAMTSLTAHSQAQTRETANTKITSNATLSYEDQLIDILKSGIKAPRMSTSIASEPANPIIQRYIDKFEKNEMKLKNVVYRTDHKTIRITWADARDNYVIKQTYSTAADSILENSKFADKNHAADTKIMYRESPDETYKYIQVIPLSMGGGLMLTHVDEHPSEERCNFCHILAKSPESPNGVFFKRYQTGGSAFDATGKVGTFFDIEDFTKIDPKDIGEKKLPKMTEPFYFRQVTMDGMPNSKSGENERILRTLIEIPHLIEVYAVDNQKSICIGIDFGSNVSHGFGHDDYVCADNKAKMIHVHFTNSLMYRQTAPKVYSEPYIDFKKLPSSKN